MRNIIYETRPNDLITHSPYLTGHHDPPVGENVLEPAPAAAAAYAAAFALYRRRGESQFAGGER